MLLNEEMSIQQMINNKLLDNFVFFEGILPYKIDINTDLYQFKLNVDLNGDYNKSKTDRKILFTTSQHWIENQKIPSIKSVLNYDPINNVYTNIISKFKICIEIFDDEIVELNIEQKSSPLQEKFRMLFQAILNYISSKYNYSLLGRDCINVSLEDCGGGAICVYKLEKEIKNYKLLMVNIIPSYSLVKNYKHNELDFKKMLLENDIIWLYYYNLSVYSFDRRDFLNTIVYLSISLESYLIFLINENQKNEEFKEYNTNLKKNNKIPGFFTTLKFIKDTNCTEENFIKDIKSCYGILNNYRNDIVHGNIQTILLNEEISKIALDKLTKIYENVESKYVSNNNF